MKQILQKMKQYVLVVLLVLMGNYGWGQVNPTAQSLPYSQNFGTATFTSMPAGMAAWGGLSGASISTLTLAESSTPSAPANIVAATGAQTGGGVFGYMVSSNGRPYIQTSSNSSNGANQIALAINTTGKENITVAYDVEIISAQPRTVGIVLQYRIGTSGSWTTITGTGNPYSQAAGTTGIKASPSIVLPSNANDKPIIQIRWATWRGTEGGNSSGIGIDNISITGTNIVINQAPTASAVSFSGTPNIGQLLTGTYTYTDAESDLEGTSTFQWYRADNASGLNSAAISGATATTYMLQAADNGKYIRFGVVPVAASGTSPGVEAFSSWQGPVTDPTAVTATLTPSVALTEQNLNVEILTLTLENTIFTDATLDAANFTLNNAPAGVVIDAVAYDTPTTALITLLYDDTDFDASIANFSVTIAASELSAAQNLSSSTVAITAVAETLSVSTITSFGSPCLNSETTQTFTVSGSNLKVGNVSLAALSGFTYSLDNTNFTPTLTIASAGGTLAATTIHVKFVPTAVQTYDGNIVVSGVGAASLNRSVVANGVNTVQTLTTPASTSITVSSAVLGGNLTGVGCTSVTTRGIEYSTTPGFSNGSGTVVSESGTFSTGTFTVNVTGLTSGTTYYYKAFATSASGTSYTTEASFSTLAIAAPLALNATGVGATSFTATWDAVPGATGYEIDVYAIDAGANATDLIISEYVEGSSSNRYIEIFNGTGSTVNLSDYRFRLYANGVLTPTSDILLSGILENNEVLVFRNSSASIAGTTGYAVSAVANFNGNDALALYKISTDSNVDIFGRIGNDPGAAWTGAGGYSTADKTLVRKSNVLSGVSVNPTGTGSSAFTTLTTDWDLYNIDNVSNLGSHSFDGGISINYILQNQNVGNVTSYPITGLDQNTAYYYVVRALDATSESVNSNEITTTTALVSTTWNGTTWSNGAPTSTVDAIIDGDFSSTGTLIAKDVTINATRTLTINAADQLSVMGNLVNNGAILFKSDATSTGRFDSYTGSAITGSGTVTMERYIDGKRAYRLLAPGVTTTGTIANNWQQQVFITGSTTGANGFDATTTGNPSMYTYENSGWAPISNTNVLTLDATKGYRMLIRGDRTPSLLTNPSEANMNTPVTLTATGSLVTGDVTFTTLPSQDYTLVGNPYVSPIDWATVTKNDIAPTYYVWDPNLGTVGQRGRYVSCDEAGLTSIVSGSGGPSSAVNAFIQPGQAFFIEKAISGTPGSITVKETDKAATFTDVFRTNSAPTTTTIEGKLGMNLYESLAYSLGDYPIDGAVAVSGTAFNTASANDDAKKLMSHGEQVAFVRENKQLGVEKVSPPQLNDVLTLATLNLVPNKNYVWSVVLQDNFSNENSYLYDAFTQTYHSLTASSTTVVSFATTADVTSTQANRFKIVFQTSVLSAPDFTNEIVVYPNPAKAQNAVCYVKGISNATVALHNVLGQNIPIQTTTDGTTLTLRPTVALNKGIYVVHIAQDGTIKQVKWIVD
jgi:hypothetical protein